MVDLASIKSSVGKLHVDESKPASVDLDNWESKVNRITVDNPADLWNFGDVAEKDVFKFLQSIMI